MTKTQTIYNDLHEFSKHEMGFRRFDWGSILLGDIIDMKMVSKKRKSEAFTFMKNLELEFGDRFVFGNHEMDITKIYDSYIENGVYYTHGHLESWGYKKAYKFMSKGMASGGLKRFGSLLFSKLRHLKGSKIKRKLKDRLAMKAIFNRCHTIVIGHKHPNKTLDFKYLYQEKEIRIIVLKRGKNVITL